VRRDDLRGFELPTNPQNDSVSPKASEVLPSWIVKGLVIGRACQGQFFPGWCLLWYHETVTWNHGTEVLKPTWKTAVARVL
jgi:hypothetical protein